MAEGGTDPLARMSLFIDPLVAGWEPLPVMRRGQKPLDPVVECSSTLLGQTPE